MSVTRRFVGPFISMVVAATALAGPVSALQPNEPTATDPPPSQQCVPGSDLVYNGSISPLVGALAPDTVVGTGARVRARVRAFVLAEDADCNVATKPFTNPAWTMRYRPRGGDWNDATGALSNASAFTPTFTAAAPGTYELGFTSTPPAGTPVQPTLWYRVEVVESPVGWVDVGPDGTASRATSTGRVNALARKSNGTLFAGAAYGGVWKSYTGGLDWTPMSDRKANVVRIAVGDVLATANGAVFLGTGDPYGGQQAGLGVMYTTDDGRGWAGDPTGCPSGRIRSSGTIWRLAEAPGSIVFAAGDAGILRRGPTDGTCWFPVYQAARATDVLVDPTDPSGNTIVFGVPGAGVLRATSALGTPSVPAELLGVGDPVVGVVDGNPSAIVRVAEGSNGTVFAAFGKGQAGTEALRLYRRPAGGPTAGISLASHTNQLGQIQGAITCWGNPCGYDLTLAVNPADPNDVWFATVPAWRSTDGGSTWVDVSNGERNGQRAIHGDVHDLQFAGSAVYLADDGGVWRSALGSAAGIVWTPLNTGLEISMFYSISAAAGRPGAIGGGLQDNGSLERVGGRKWANVGDAGGDGWSVAYDAADSVASCAVSCARSRIWYHRGWFNGNNISSTRSYPATLAFARPFWTDPLRPGVLLGVSSGNQPPGQVGGQLYISFGNDGVTPPSWSCIDPTPADQTDGVAAVIPTRSVLNPTAPAYVVAVNGGSAGPGVYLVTLASQPIGGAMSCSGGSVATSQPLFAANGSNGVTWVNDVTEDPRQPCRLFLAAVTSVRQWRAIRLASSDNVCGPTMTATPIAGLAADTAPVTAGLQVFSVLSDPLLTGLVHVGTSEGLFSGDINGGTPVAWTRAPDMPFTAVRTLTVQQSAANVGNAVYAGTFGRGVWQRIWTAPPPVAAAVGQGMSGDAAGAPAPDVIGTDALHGLHVTQCEARLVGTEPGGDGRAAMVQLFYDNRVESPSELYARADATVHGHIQPNFIRERGRLGHGSNWTELLLLYADKHAPMRLQTDGLEVDILSSGNDVLARIHCSFQATWQKATARFLTVTGLVRQGEAGLAVAGVKARVWRDGHVVSEGQTPLVVPVDKGTVLTIERVGGLAGAHFAGYLVDGDAARTTSLTLRMGHDRQVAIYFTEAPP